MSRGLGRIERSILAILEAASGPLDAYELAERHWQIPIAPDGRSYASAADIVDVKRALNSLKRKGFPIDRIGRGGRRMLWIHAVAIPRIELFRDLGNFDEEYGVAEVLEAHPEWRELW